MTPTPGLPEPFASFSDLRILRTMAYESEQAKHLLRNAGFGVTGTPIVETVKQVLRFVEEHR